MKKITICLIIFIITAVNISAQKADYSKEQGFYDLSAVTSLAKGDKGTEILVEAGMLKMLAKMTNEKNEEIAKQLGELKLVRLNSFEVNDSNIKAVEDKIALIDKELTGKNWDRLARMKGENEFYNIYVKTAGTEKFQGIVITSINGKAQMAAFVNVVGDIYPEIIGKLAKNFNIPQLGNIHKGMKK
jgi:hypothetical protein